MRNVGPRTSVQGLRGRVSVRLALALLTLLLLLPTESPAVSARLTWQPSTDSRVTGYFVYVRQATMPYGVAIDAGAPRPAGDGTLSYVVSGLSDTQTYFLALTAYTATNLESGLSNELPIGTPNPCVQDVCVGKTQCSVVNLPDGTGCGGAGGTQCGASCLSGTCAGISPLGSSLDSMKLRLSDSQFRITASGHFTSSPSFDPTADGLDLTVTDAAGTPLAQVSLPASSFVGSPDGNSIKLVRQKGDQGPVRRLIFRTGGDQTRWKVRLSDAPPGGLPSGGAVTLESGSTCLASSVLACRVRGTSASCR